MIVVLDASAAAEIVLRRTAATELSDFVAAADWVIAPTLFVSEIVNVFWKYHSIANYPYEACDKHIEHAIALPDDYIDEIDIYREAFNMGCKLNHPIYDMMYLVLARRNNALLLTMDKKLTSAA